MNMATGDKGLGQRNERLVSGVYAAALTPMHEDFTCNYEELASHCNYH